MCLVCDRIQMIQAGQNPYFVKELETGYVVIGDNQHFRGYSLFLCKQHQTELFYLEKDFAAKFMEEMILVSQAVKNAFGAEKMNYECLGQGAAHLHWHLYPRRKGDIGEYGNHGAGPVWWYPMELMYQDENRPTEDDLASMKKDLLRELEKLLAADSRN
ncbi:HIT family protein [Acutalibacter sp. 1XD8-33]|uniref:HIT family protein n=1 Tax=Acutalibacter sp. 1XD8-33 TaxID=2320081 RepID=UPI000EA1A2EA|nr:HIT family protein [Acutalibacter sp. 1XD8-33]RKJ39859.1 HIT family protein [Acutalibacter sp. 1XD8-33]